MIDNSKPERQEMSRNVLPVLKELSPGLYTTNDLFEKVTAQYPAFNSAWDLGATLKSLGLKSRVVRRNGENTRVYYIDFTNIK